MISVEFKFKLENGETHIVKIKDVISTATEAEITTLGNSFIDSRGHYKGIKFVELLESARVVTTRETF